MIFDFDFWEIKLTICRKLELRGCIRMPTAGYMKAWTRDDFLQWAVSSLVLLSQWRAEFALHFQWIFINAFATVSSIVQKA